VACVIAGAVGCPGKKLVSEPKSHANKVSAAMKTTIKKTARVLAETILLFIESLLV
jgi:hypothetical protein